MNFKKYLDTNLAVSLLLFSIVWILVNNSYDLSRDEMWYADYSVKYNDSETTDIRHLSEIDVHQIAFSHVYRNIERGMLNIFGENIFGLRVLNLLLSLLLIYTVHLWQSKSIEKHKNKLIVFTSLLLFLPILSIYSHHARPDWAMMMITATSLILLVIGIERERDKYLYVASFLFGLAAVIYWSGIAALAGALVIFLFMYITEESNKSKYIYIVISLFALPIVYFLYIATYEFNELISLFTEKKLQTGRLLSEPFISKYMSSLNIFLDNLIKSRTQSFMSLCLIFGPLILLYLDGVALVDSKKRKIIKLLYLFIFTYLAVSLVRGGGVRYLNFIIPVFLFLNIYVLTILNQKREGLISRGYFIGIIMLVILSIFKTTIYAYDNKGQWSQYKKYESDLQYILKDSDGRALTSFEFAWILKDIDKLYIESFIFFIPDTYHEFREIMLKSDVNILIIDEATRSRMFNTKNDNGNGVWYQYLHRYMSENFIKKEEVFNIYYRKNKKMSPSDNRGYKTEIWQKL
jgi:4-amino-4-deoxy-L-arabinose transferase-like glycosyltransferase